MIYKRGKKGIYWYRFQWNGKLIRESTKQTNDKKAREMESKHRTRLADEQLDRSDAMKRLQATSVERCPECESWFDLAHPVQDASGRKFCSSHCVHEWTKKHRVIPTLDEFITTKVEPWAKTEFETTVPNSWFWYRNNFGVIRKSQELTSLPLDKITDDAVLAFKRKRLEEGYAIGTINSTLRVLRSSLHRAVPELTAHPASNFFPSDKNDAVTT